MELLHLLVLCLVFHKASSTRSISAAEQFPEQPSTSTAAAAAAGSSSTSDALDYIIVFNQDIVDVQTATAKLLQDFQQLNANAAAVAAAAAPVAAALQIVNVLGAGSPTPRAAESGSGSSDASGSDPILDRLTTAQGTSPPVLKGLVVRGITAKQAAALAQASSSVVESIIPDVVTRAAGNYRGPQLFAGDCLVVDFTYQALNKGVESPNGKLTGFSWPGCLTPKTRLSWSGQRCGSAFNQINYTQVAALTSTGAVARSSTTGKPCIMLRDPAKPSWSQQRFGKCGIVPTWARSLPTWTCPVVNPIGGCVSASMVNGQEVGSVRAALTTEVDCEGKKYKQLTYYGAVGSYGMFQWTKAVTPDGCVLKRSATTDPVKARFNLNVFGTVGVQPAVVAGNMPQAKCQVPHVLARTLLQPNESMPYNLQVIEAVEQGKGVDVTQLQAAHQVVVAVADTGIDRTHEDLVYVGGQSFGNDGGDPGVDQHGHGTAVGGIIGARNNGKGVVGVAAGLPLFALQVLDGTTGPPRGKLSWMIESLNWVLRNGTVDHKIRVVNLSLEIETSNASYPSDYKRVCDLAQSLSDAGVLLVAAAGNNGEDMTATFPAACPSILAVASFDSDLEPAPDSNWLPDTATDQDKAHLIAAPGQDIFSTASRLSPADFGYTNNYGTSFAAPHVAAIAANCIMSGDCAPGDTGAAMMAKIQAAASERAQLVDSGYPWGPLQGVKQGRFYGLRAWSKY